jgi:hypothetical protein
MQMNQQSPTMRMSKLKQTTYEDSAMTQQSMLPEAPSRSRRRDEVTMAEFIAACKVAGEMAIPAGGPGLCLCRALGHQ